MGIASQLNDVCHDLIFSIILGALFGFTFIITIGCGVYLVYNFCCNDKICGNSSQGTNTQKRLKILCIVAEIQCTFCQISVIGMIYFLYLECIDSENATPVEESYTVHAKIAGFLCTSTYQCSLTIVFLVFVYRVVAAFSGSVYALSRKKTVLLSMLLGIQFSCNIIAACFFIIETKYALIFMAASLVKYIYSILIS